jgi:hypothetical protein
MPPKRTPSRAAVAVSLKALQNRAFFNRLVADPRKALTPKVKKDLGLSAADVSRVAKAVNLRRAKISPADARKAWDQWHKTGTADLFIPLWPIVF